jgi:hypothetical protein
MASIAMSNVEPAALEEPASKLTIKENVVPVDPPFYTIDDLLRARAAEPEEYPIVAYPASTTGVTDYVEYAARDLDRFTNAGIARYRSLGLEPPVSASPLLN